MENKLFASIVMPVYNAAPFLKAAIESVLWQSYQNFEFIIVNDGSTDESDDIIVSYNDSRIRYKKFIINQGIVAALNYGIGIALGEYIFRMDADDICLPHRVEKQLNFLLKHSDIDLLGSQAIFFSEAFNHKNKLSGEVMNSSNVIEQMLFLCSPFIHPTIVFKKEIENVGTLQYGTGFNYADDYELFTRNVGKIQYGYLNEPVLNYRVHQSQNRLSTKTFKVKYKQSTFLIRKFFFYKQSLFFPEKLLNHYEDLFYGDTLIKRSTCLLTILFYKKILEHYKAQKLSNNELNFLLNFLRESFFNSYYQFSKNGIPALVAYFKFCRKSFKMDTTNEVKFILKCFLKK